MTLSASLQNRERDLRQQLDEKQHGLDADEGHAGRRNWPHSRNSRHRVRKPSRISISTLESRLKESAGLIASLQEKLADVEKDRNVTADTLRTREQALRKELTDKEQAWTRTQQTLQEALDSQKKAATLDSAVKDSRIVELEKSAADAEKYIQTLRDKLQSL